MKKLLLVFWVLLIAVSNIFGGPAKAQSLTQGQMAWYKFNELSSTAAIDSSGNANDGIISGPVHQSGLAGTALSFAAGSNVRLPDNMLGSSNGSFSAWIKSSKSYTTNGMLFYGAAQSGNGNGGQAELHVHFNSGGTLGIYSRIGNSSSGKDVSFNTTEKYNDNQWHHVAGTWNYDTGTKIMKVSLYVDGIKKGEKTYNNSTTNLSTFNFSKITYLGRSGSDASRVFVGLMDEARIYNRQLNDNEVAELAVLPVPEWISGSNLTVSELKTRTLTLQWPAASEKSGTKYRISRSAGNSTTLLGTVTDTLTFPVTGLEAATTYTFSVETGNSSGWNTSALFTTITTRDDSIPPVWPPESAITASEAKATRVRLTWAPPYPTDDKGVTRFILYQNGTVINDSIPSAEYSYLVTGLSPETSYVFRVEAADASLNVSENGPELTFVTPEDTDAPVWPANTRVAASRVEKSSFLLAWTAAVDDVGVTSYRVYQDGSLIATTTENTLPVSGLPEGGTFTYKIEAGDARENWSSSGPSINVTLYNGTTKSVFEEINSFEPRFVLPAGTGMKNIKTDFGAKGDGVTDDTEAFKKWLASKGRSLYIPEGTYLLSDQIRLASGMKRVTMMGEKRRTTIIRLIDSASGFNDPNSPKVFIHMRASNQQAEQNFANYIYHLTIEIGKNNPGTIALNYHTNNTGQLKDVTVRAEDPVNHRGFRGVAFDDYWFGPGGARYLEIDGFKEGALIGSAQNHVTLEHVNITNCETGIRNNGNACSFRKIAITGSEQGIRNLGAGLIAMQEISILNGSGGDALYNEGRLLVRDLQTSGYAKAIASTTEMGDAAGPNVGHYTGTPVITNWPTPAGLSKTLGLAVEESPEFQYPQSSSEWAVSPASGDITTAVQQAIDNGASTVYVAGGEIRGTIYLRNNIQRIMGAGVKMLKFKTGSQPVFKLEDGSSPAVILELMYPDYGGNTTVPHCMQASARSFVLRHGGLSYNTAAEGEGGKAFVESVVSYPFHFTKVNAWLRDINTEQGGDNVPNILNDNGKVWILGQKTEDYAIKIKTVNGGSTELMGGTYRQNWDAADGVNDLLEGNPLFLIDNSVATFSFKTFTSASSTPNYKYLVREIRGTETRNIVHSSHGGCCSGTQSLFVGRPCPPVDKPAITSAGATSFCAGDSVQLRAAAIPNVTYQWFKNDTIIASATRPDFFAKETGDYTLQMMLESGCTAVSDSIHVEVLADTIPPEITLTSNPVQIWPPNNKYVSYSVNDMVQSVSDLCEGSILIDRVRITSTGSDETANTQSQPQYIISDDGKSVQVMASRNGDGDGRTYTIQLAVTDRNGNTGTADFKVIVPHDQGNRGANRTLSIPAEQASGLPDTSPFSGAAAGLRAYPNPSDGNFTLQFKADAPGKASLQVAGVNGQIVLSDTIQINQGENSVSLNLQSAVSGTYYVRVLIAGKVLTTKLLIVK